MKLRFEIIPIAKGTWEYRDGDIVGIDNRAWISFGPDTYLVKNLKTKVIYKKEFISKYAANKFISNRRKFL